MPMFRVSGEARPQAEIRDALGSPNGTDWLVPVGGVGIATPFSSGTVIMDLTAGQYVVACFFGGHYARGMYRVVNVTASNATTEAPTANYTVTLTDFAFNAPNMTNGTHVVAVKNNGTQPHEAPLVKLAPNTTLMQFLQAIEDPNATAPPPGQGVGGVNVLAPGQTAYFVLRSGAGSYGMVCFVEDPASGKPHAELGMVAELVVA